MSTAGEVHVFEKAGLGRAPFRCVGMERKVGPIKLGDGTEIGAPGQPMGTCDFCGTGIADCFQIVSADGRAFVVGCDCVAKTGDGGLRKVVDAKVAELRRTRDRERRQAKAAAVSAELSALLQDENVRAALRALPHPQAWRAEKGETRLDSCVWFRANAGDRGRADTLAYIKRTLGLAS